MARRRNRVELKEARAFLEPLGIISGPGAREAIECNLALPLRGGPSAFCLVRQLPDGKPVPVSRWPGALDALTARPAPWAGLQPGPQLMGILNVTPDSFSDGGRSLDPATAVELGEQMLADGAALLDVGGESTRPGSAPVPPEEEQRRILPVIASLARSGARISVDTRNATTMASALDAGAMIVNDVSALRHDPAAAALLARRGCPVILMHMRGTPQTMTGLTRYDQLATEVLGELAERIDAAEEAGIGRAQIAIDPGFGFAKTGEQSRELLQRLAMFLNYSRPIIAGISRKRFVGDLANVPSAEERDQASLAAGLVALSRGATILRVHNVLATLQAVRVWQALQG